MENGRRNVVSIHFWRMKSADCQGLRHFKAKAKGAEDSEEHTCTSLHAAILYARDIHISIVEDEEHTEDVTAMFGTEFLIWFEKWRKSTKNCCESFNGLRRIVEITILHTCIICLQI